MKKQEFTIFIVAYFHVFVSGQIHNTGSQIGTQVVINNYNNHNPPINNFNKPQICEDKQSGCSQNLWKSKCHGKFRDWMIKNCPKTCGMCNSGMLR